MPAIALSQVAVSFRLADGSFYPAVERISLAVAGGEFVGDFLKLENRELLHSGLL